MGNAMDQIRTMPISAIVVSDRVRKKCSNIESLAESINKIGLLSPIIINSDNRLLAGERRFEACKSLGWTDINAIIRDTADVEQELDVELSENQERSDFTREEVIDFGTRYERIESAKAEERRNSKLKQNNSEQFETGTECSMGNEKPRKIGGSTVRENFPYREGGKVADIVGQKLGMSGKQYRKEKQIVENKDLFSQEEYEDWNNRVMSTNKAYTILSKKLGTDKVQKKKVTKNDKVANNDYEELKAEKLRLEQEKRELEEEIKKLNELKEFKELEKVKSSKEGYPKNEELYETVDTEPEHKEVDENGWYKSRFPDDFDEARRSLDELSKKIVAELRAEEELGDDPAKLRKQILEMRQQLASKDEQLASKDEELVSKDKQLAALKSQSESGIKLLDDIDTQSFVQVCRYFRTNVLYSYVNTSKNEDKTLVEDKTFVEELKKEAHETVDALMNLIKEIDEKTIY